MGLECGELHHFSSSIQEALGLLTAAEILHRLPVDLQRKRERKIFVLIFPTSSKHHLQPN